ncbi:MAG TPA: hypothetical protein VHY22_07300 [Chthoniobacteraceae bacterium]|jgi:hypothetical protein|nr:hypothetical protein [Chthoniobacteraceae bacterium]
MCKPVFLALLAAAILAAGCASTSHHNKDFIPTGASLNLEPTNPDHIQVLNSIPRGMVIGTILVDRSKAKNIAEIVQMAKIKAASVGGDFIVWEDSLGTVATPASTAPAMPNSDNTSLGHDAALPAETPPEETSEKAPKARFTVGIFLPDGAHQ